MRSLSRLAVPMIVLSALVAGPGTSVARADTSTAPDVVVYADPTIAATMGRLGDAFRGETGVPVRLFPIPSSLATALVHQGTRDDVLAIEAGTAAAAHDRGLARPPAFSVHDPIVLAAPDGVSATLADAATASGKVATVDPVSTDRLDGPALAGRLAIASVRVAGEPSGPRAVGLVTGGTATLALVERVDARRPGVHEVAVVPDATARARTYAIAVSQKAMSPNLDRFLTWVAGPEATAIINADGWEISR